MFGLAGSVLVARFGGSVTGTNTITLLGNVVVSQGGNVVRGERLVVDMTTGVSKV